MFDEKKVIVISYNAFSKEGANGRTLEFLVSGFAKENVAQLYFSGETPDFDFCKNYYSVPETQIPRAIIKRKTVGGPVLESTKDKNSACQKHTGIAAVAKKRKKSSIIKFLRGAVWSIGKKRWKNKAFDKWIEEFSPDVILTISGKNACFHKIVTKLSKQLKVPLVVYHCEDYAFKKYNKFSILKGIYLRGLRKSLNKMMDQASLAIYNSDSTKKLYEKYYSVNNIVAYMSTDMVSVKRKEMSSKPTFTYLGNIAIGRDEAILDFAQQVKQLNPLAKIEVFAPSLPDGVAGKFLEAENIEYKGFVSYSECEKIIHSSDFLFHVESFNEAFKGDITLAFSTKIADSLASGVPFIVYGPKDVASVQYLLNNDCAFVATNKDELAKNLNEALYNQEKRDYYKERASLIVEKNHRIGQTTKMIKENINNL